jgi:hypothetical protein
MNTTPTHIIIDGDAIAIQPHTAHEYLATTKEVARGYGVSEATLRKHKERHADELISSTHWATVTNSHGGEPATLWTKLGVITLGFFIRSERAKRFRAAAAQLVLRHTEPQHAAQQGTSRELVAILSHLTHLCAINKVGVDNLTACYTELVRTQVDLQRRVQALETSPAARGLPPRRGVSIAQIDEALFSGACSPQRWVGTSATLHLALASVGKPFEGQLGLGTLARDYPERCLDLRSLTRGSKRAFVIFHPAHVPDAIDRQLLRADLVNAINGKNT